MVRRVVNGNDLLYKFFQKVLPQEPELFEAVPRLLVLSMSVWLPVSVYSEIPVLLPWVLRDPSCRGKRVAGKLVTPDEWATPNVDGYLRDDNSLVKGIPKSLRIESSNYSYFNGCYLGNEFVAAHIWREYRSGKHASRIPMLNTFVPNLVWLPSQIAKLSDREGSEVQLALKEISWSIYRRAKVEQSSRAVAEHSWSLLTKPKSSRDYLPDEINWFIQTHSFMNRRKSKFKSVIDSLSALNRGQPVPTNFRPTRYRDGLATVSAAKRRKLQNSLRYQNIN